MLCLHLTKSLATKCNVDLQDGNFKSDTVLGSWYANNFQFGREQFILCLNERTRFPIFIPAAPYASFPNRLIECLFSIMLYCNIDREVTTEEVKKMTQIVCTKTASRSHLGTMNNFIELFRHHLEDFHGDTLNLAKISLRLSTVPLVNEKYFCAFEEFMRLFGKEVERPYFFERHSR